MTSTASSSRSGTWSLILVPAIISLFVTLLRLVGELRGWSEEWFTTQTGGVVPWGMSWVFGITWLAIPFGIYFAWKLAKRGDGPKSRAKAVGVAIAGIILAIAGLFFIRPLIPLGFPALLIPIWLMMAVAAALQYFGWPKLFKTLLAYGFAARIPVVIVMFFALWGRWGTHYDYVGMPPEFDMPLLSGFFWLAFFPQLIFWVGYTVLVGSFAGAIAVALFKVTPVEQAKTTHS